MFQYFSTYIIKVTDKNDKILNIEETFDKMFGQLGVKECSLISQISQ